MKLWVPHTTLSMNILTKDWKHRESGVKELLGVSVYSTTSYTCTKYNDVTRIYLSHLISRHASSLHQQGQTRHRNENTKKNENIYICCTYVTPRRHDPDVNKTQAREIQTLLFDSSLACLATEVWPYVCMCVRVDWTYRPVNVDGVCASVHWIFTFSYWQSGCLLESSIKKGVWTFWKK